MNGKWMLALLAAHKRALLCQVAECRHIKTFKSVADIDVGIVTGANKFFLVPDCVVSEHGLEPWAYPMFGRSEHVAGVVYDKKAHEENRKKGMPTNFIWFQEGLFSDSRQALRYIKFGESQNLHQRYKCGIRTPWYSVPSVYASPVGMLKRAHHFPRLVLNRLKAFTTDTAYRITPQGIDASDLVASFVNSLTALTAKLEGRHYGGGVLELVPSEIEKLLVPVVPHSRDVLADLDSRLSRMLPEGGHGETRRKNCQARFGFSRSDCDKSCGKRRSGSGSVASVPAM